MVGVNGLDSPPRPETRKKCVKCCHDSFGSGNCTYEEKIGVPSCSSRVNAKICL